MCSCIISCASEQPAQQNRYSEGWPGILGNILMSANSNFGPVDDIFRSRLQTSLSCLGGQSKNIRCVIRYPHPTARNYLRIKNNNISTISWSIDHGVCDDLWNDDELGLTSIGLVLDFLPASSTCPNSKAMEKQQWDIKDMTAVQLGRPYHLLISSSFDLGWSSLPWCIKCGQSLCRISFSNSWCVFRPILSNPSLKREAKTGTVRQNQQTREEFSDKS